MPVHERSLRLTNAYRDRLSGLADVATRYAEGTWNLNPDNLDSSFAPWLARTSAAVAGAQQQAVRASAGYLAAYIGSEIGQTARVAPLDSKRYVGLARNGRPITDLLGGALIAVKVGLKDGRPMEEALGLGLERAKRNSDFSVWTAGRDSLRDAMVADERVIGWRRAVKGTCDACLGAAESAYSPAGTSLECHPNCQCVSEGVVYGATHRNLRPTGTEIFAAMTAPEQDAQFGPEKATALRDGEITLADLVDHSHLAEEPDFITTAPLPPAAKANERT